MPAIAREIDGALEEGVTIEFLTAPAEVLRDNGTARALKCIRMELGEPDASGRPKPMPIPGSEFEIEASTIIAAISQEPELNRIAELRDTERLHADAWGATGKTGIYAGGDDLALALVATAINQGRLSAQAIDAYLRGGDLPKPAAHPEANKVIADWHMEADRHERPRIPVERRDMNTEIERSCRRTTSLKRQNAACPAECVWIVKAAGCIAPTTALSGCRKESTTASRWNCVTDVKSVPKAAPPVISNSSKFQVASFRSQVGRAFRLQLR